MVMEAIIRATAGTGGGGAATVVDDDLGEEGMQCIKHPYRNTASNGGICPLCVQDKLDKLVSSASSSLFNVAASSSFSSSSSFRFDPCSTANAPSLSLTLALRPTARPLDHSTCSPTNQTTTRQTLIPFLFPHKKNKITTPNLFLKRSKSVVAPRRQHSSVADEYVNPAQKNQGGFWSFLYYSKRNRTEKASSSSSSSARDLKPVPRQPPDRNREDIWNLKRKKHKCF